MCGSFNATQSASSRNEELALCAYGMPTLFRTADDHFKRLYSAKRLTCALHETKGKTVSSVGSSHDARFRVCPRPGYGGERRRQHDPSRGPCDQTDQQQCREVIDHARYYRGSGDDKQRRYQNPANGHLADHGGECQRCRNSAQVCGRAELSGDTGGQVEVGSYLVQERSHAGLVWKRERYRDHQRRECEMLRSGTVT
mgnify:CR=1 FL=1